MPFLFMYIFHVIFQFIVAKFKRPISKRLFVRTQSMENFPKTNISYPLISFSNSVILHYRERIYFPEVLLYWNIPLDIWASLCVWSWSWTHAAVQLQYMQNSRYQLYKVLILCLVCKFTQVTWQSWWIYLWKSFVTSTSLTKLQSCNTCWIWYANFGS